MRLQEAGLVAGELCRLSRSPKSAVCHPESAGNREWRTFRSLSIALCKPSSSNAACRQQQVRAFDDRSPSRRRGGRSCWVVQGVVQELESSSLTAQ